MISRPYYLDKILAFRDTERLIKVLVGIRRCGKSSLLELFHDYLVADGVLEQSILSLNFESLELVTVDSAQALHDYVIGWDFPPGKRYIFLDEVQLIPDWERAVNSLRLDPNNDIYLTGSNSRLLSSELATLLSGRYVQIEVFPLSFAEYCQFRQHDPATPVAELFNEYLANGGLPGQFDLRDDAGVRFQYIEGVISTIITKDVIARRQVRDSDALMKIIQYLLSNIGNLVTASGIANYLTSTGRRISADTVDHYLTLLENAYLFYRAKREDLRGKTIMKTNDKFFVPDLGFRTVSRGLGTTDLGRLLENIVYFELRRRYSKVSVGKYHATQIDFVAFTPDQPLAYFQVCQTMIDESIQARELRPLLALADAYPKTILSLDQVRTADFSGIRHLNLIDWLLAG